MRPITITVTGVAASAPIVLDQHISPFAVSIFCEVSATATYTVQYTPDNPFATASGFSGTPTWTDHPSLTAKTTNADSNLAFPASAVRLNVTASTGSVTIFVKQAGLT